MSKVKELKTRRKERKIRFIDRKKRKRKRVDESEEDNLHLESQLPGYSSMFSNSG